MHQAPRTRAQTFLLTTTLLAALMATHGAALAQEAGPPPGSTVVQGRILVMARAGVSDEQFDRIVRSQGATKGRRVGQTGLRVVSLPAGAEEAMVARLARHPHVKFAELDRRVRPGMTTNDPYLGSAWHLPHIGAPAAWDASLGAGVTIAVLDTGVDASHPDLAAVMVPGWNFYDGNNNTADVHGHGTSVAGSAAAIANNATGVAGVAGRSRVMPLRISDAAGWATYSAMADAIVYAADNGAKVANVSYMGAGSAAVQSAGAYMKSRGGLVTVSAGNYGTDAGIAATTSLIPVSATNSSDTRTSWSSFGAYVALAAPGEGIYTTALGNAYGAVSGTSFSSPVTAGTIALLMAARPDLPNTTIESILYSTAVDLGAAGRDVYYGHGRIDAAAAMRTAMAATTLTADRTAPSASIVAPLGSSTVAGLVPVDVRASDNVAVTRVELRANNTLVATDTASPYAFSIDTTRFANGPLSVVATAYDAAGNASPSATVTVSVANSVVQDATPPVVSISNPRAGEVMTGTVQVRLAASDNAGSAGISQTLQINGKVVARGTGGVLSYSWNTRKISRGSYTLQAVATDAAGNTGTQSIVVSR